MEQADLGPYYLQQSLRTLADDKVLIGTKWVHAYFHCKIVGPGQPFVKVTTKPLFCHSRQVSSAHISVYALTKNADDISRRKIKSFDSPLYILNCHRFESKQCALSYCPPSSQAYAQSTQVPRLKK